MPAEAPQVAQEAAAIIRRLVATTETRSARDRRIAGLLTAAADRLDRMAGSTPPAPPEV